MRLQWYLPGVLLAILSAVGAAQTAPGKNRYPVTGIVVNSVTGEPIRRALVRANNADLTFTGPDGRFQMDVPEGRFSFTAQKPGFFDPRSTPNNGIVQPFTFMVGSGKNDIVLKLIPEATIRGRIVDSDGEPIEGIPVQLTIQAVINGRKQLSLHHEVVTTEDGTYRMDGLPPGAYLVNTAVHSVFFQSANAPAVSEFPAQVYPERFYPDSPDASAAQPIDLKPGQEAEADFTLSPVPAFRVRGSISGAQNGVFASVQDTAGQQIPVAVDIDPRTGRFVLPNIPAGTWTLTFASPNSQGDSLHAEQTVTIESSNVDGLQVLLQPLPSISVDVINQNQPGPPQVQVQLIVKRHRSQGRLFARAEPGDPQAELTFRGVEPGEYQVLAQSFSNACVQSISSGSVDLTQNDLVIAAGSQPQPINVTLGTDCATISGMVRAENQPANGVVLLTPHSLSNEPKILPIGTDGTFTFPNLSPGEYQIYAFSTIEGLEYANPEAMRDFASQKVELTPNQKSNVTVDLIVRGGN